MGMQRGLEHSRPFRPESAVAATFGDGRCGGQARGENGLPPALSPGTCPRAPRWPRPRLLSAADPGAGSVCRHLREARSGPTARRERPLDGAEPRRAISEPHAPRAWIVPPLYGTLAPESRSSLALRSHLCSLRSFLRTSRNYGIDASSHSNVET